MDIVGFILSQTLFDILFVLALLAALILGFLQGAIRRLLGIVAMVVAFLLAANLRDPIGGYLAENWRQFPPAYSVMLGFLVLFVVLWVGLSILIQGFYRRSLLNRSEALDEIVGALLGVAEAVLLVAFLGAILDSYFDIPMTLRDRNEIEALRTLFQAWDLSRIAPLFRETITPSLLGFGGWLLPEAIEKIYRR